MPEINTINRPPTAPVRDAQPPRARPPDAPPTVNEIRTERTQSESAPAEATRPRRPELLRSPFQARLNYDIVDEDIYIEILSPRTGDVIQRLPPEDAVDQIRSLSDGGPGAVVDQKT